jgi:hypothetical protein
LCNDDGDGIADVRLENRLLSTVTVTIPEVLGTYAVPVIVWERRCGREKRELTFEVIAPCSAALSVDEEGQSSVSKRESTALT